MGCVDSDRARAKPMRGSAAQRRAQILNAAAACFIAKGDGVRVTDIAAKAAISRQTLYKHFPTKEAMLIEAIRHAAPPLRVTIGEETNSLRETLVDFGIRVRQTHLTPRTIGVYHNAIAAFPRLPSLARVLLQKSAVGTQKALSTFLLRRLSLEPYEAEFAASMLLGMLFEYERSRHFLEDTHPRCDQREKVEKVVKCFLLGMRNTRPER